MTLSTFQLGIQWTIWCYLLIVVIAEIYWLFRFIQSRNELHIRVRNPMFTYLFVIATISMISGRMWLQPISCPFEYAALLDDGSYEQSPLMRKINLISSSIRGTLLSTAFVMKLWYLYYALKLQAILINGKWWTQINENLNQNWWIKNADKYGRPNKTTWIILIVFMVMISAFATIVGIVVNPFMPRLVMSAQVVACSIGAILFHCKIPAIHDIYGMRQEMKLITIATCTAMFYFPIVNIAQGGADKYFGLSMFSGIMSGIVTPLMVWGVTMYPNRLYTNYKPKAKKDSRMDSVTHTSEHRAGDECNWKDIVRQNVEILHSFMRFLCRSFCVENMLFFIEIMQFKREFMAKKEKENMKSESDGTSSTDIDCGFFVRLYDEESEKDDEMTIPKSTIIYGDYTLNQQITMIFEKYISTSAGLEINISFEARSKLESIITNDVFENNDDEQVLIKLFDEAITEIMVLLNASFYRFQKEDNYSEMIITQDRTDVNEQIMIAMQQQTQGH